MRKLFTKIATSLLATMALLTLAVTPVAAEHGSSGTSGSGDTATTASTTTTTTDGSDSSEPNETEVQTQVQTFKSQAAQLLATQRQKGQQHSADARMNACKARQTEINNKVDNWSKHAQSLLDVFNKINTRVQAFQKTKNVTPTDWSTLVATTTADQQKAVDAVAALKALDVKVDCTSTDPAASLSTVKTAADAARTALHTYRTDIKNEIVALGKAIGASSSSSDTTDTTTKTTTTSTGGND